MKIRFGGPLFCAKSRFLRAASGPFCSVSTPGFYVFCELLRIVLPMLRGSATLFFIVASGGVFLMMLIAILFDCSTETLFIFKVSAKSGNDQTCIENKAKSPRDASIFEMQF